MSQEAGSAIPLVSFPLQRQRNIKANLASSYHRFKRLERMEKGVTVSVDDDFARLA